MARTEQSPKTSKVLHTRTVKPLHERHKQRLAAEPATAVELPAPTTETTAPAATTETPAASGSTESPQRKN